MSKAMTPVDPLKYIRERLGELPADPADTSVHDMHRLHEIQVSLGELIDILVSKSYVVDATIKLGGHDALASKEQQTLRHCQEALDVLARYGLRANAVHGLDANGDRKREHATHGARAHRQEPPTFTSPQDAIQAGERGEESEALPGIETVELSIELRVAAGEGERCPTVELESGIAEYRSGGVVGKVARDRRRAAFSDPLFSRFVRSAWRHLSSARLLPATARQPSVKVIPGEGAFGGMRPYTVDKTTILVPRKAAEAALDDRNENSSWAKQAIVHEFAHSMQRKDLSLREAEGGAAAWSEQAEWKAGFRDFFPPPQEGYQADMDWVEKNKGQDWIFHKQFRVV
jgi:hypothetical protein